MSGRARGRILYKLADLIEEHTDELAAIESIDNGKPIKYAKFVDVPSVRPAFHFFFGN